MYFLNNFSNSDKICSLMHNIKLQNSVDLVLNIIPIHSKIHNGSICTNALCLHCNVWSQYLLLDLQKSGKQGKVYGKCVTYRISDFASLLDKESYPLSNIQRFSFLMWWHESVNDSFEISGWIVFSFCVEKKRCWRNYADSAFFRYFKVILKQEKVF